MFDCPNCGSNTKKLIGSSEKQVVGCPNCITEHRLTPCNLHQVVEQTPDGKHRVTRGKMDEIDHRRIADDGVTVYNYKTGKEAQY